MSFIRVVVAKASGSVVAVLESDIPFGDRSSYTDSGQEVDLVDLGFAAPREWIDLDGVPCTPARHVFLRLDRDHSDMPRIYDVPCTMSGMAAHVRAGRAVHGVVRAWLAVVLPEHFERLFGKHEDFPLSVIKAAEAMRVRRDPGGPSSRVPMLEGLIHEQAGKRSAAQLELRKQIAVFYYDKQLEELTGEERAHVEQEFRDRIRRDRRPTVPTRKGIHG